MHYPPPPSILSSRATTRHLTSPPLSLQSASPPSCPLRISQSSLSSPSSRRWPHRTASPIDANCARAILQREAWWSDELADQLAHTLPTEESRSAGADRFKQLRTCVADFAQESYDRLTTHKRRIQELLRRIGEAENGKLRAHVREALEVGR